MKKKTVLKKVSKKTTKKAVKKVAQTKKVLTDESLTNALWSTINGVLEGTMEPTKATAIALSAREITRVQRTKIEAFKLGIGKINNVKLLG